MSKFKPADRITAEELAEALESEGCQCHRCRFYSDVFREWQEGKEAPVGCTFGVKCQDPNGVILCCPESCPMSRNAYRKGAQYLPTKYGQDCLDLDRELEGVPDESA